jgi:hypothetical protein
LEGYFNASVKYSTKVVQTVNKYMYIIVDKIKRGNLNAAMRQCGVDLTTFFNWAGVRLTVCYDVSVIKGHLAIAGTENLCGLNFGAMPNANIKL